MKYLSLFACATLLISSAIAASLPETPDRGGNTIVLEVVSGELPDHKKAKSGPPGQDAEPFEIVVPIARNFTSLKELFEILRDGDDSGEPRVMAGATPTYVKGTESNSSEYSFFFVDVGRKSVSD